MALFGFGKKKSEERWHAAQLKENELSVKAADTQRHIDYARDAARREGEKERSAEVGGNVDAAARAREKRVDLERKGDALQREGKQFEAGAKEEREKAEREGAKIQSADKILERATAFAPVKQNGRNETAKEMYTREAVKDKANEKGLRDMPLDQQERLEAIRARLRLATEHTPNNQPPSPTANDEDGAAAAMRQKLWNQEKQAPALSPTTNLVGTKEARVPGTDQVGERAGKDTRTATATPPVQQRKRSPSRDR